MKKIKKKITKHIKLEVVDNINEIKVGKYYYCHESDVYYKAVYRNDKWVCLEIVYDNNNEEGKRDVGEIYVLSNRDFDLSNDEDWDWLLVEVDKDKVMVENL